ncbi:iron siderophore-binding protein [Lottiidibacillus patelloidae]|uniref:Iron siderophore-binding protein n=1 Tax=Lottiidibacillus patelloidae TaxID=2670334 RepID=A0A263BSS8_9BACI|nr:iron-siderophore ABC transporter substrate-binding protein [Lottiidibacillus patelloidae]OZM56632.1 iron siderophore-binding protein [Lottiidibacillus patelloidae]
MKKIVIAIITLMVFALTACGNDSTTESVNENNSYKVVHAMGEATIEGTPKRIVVLTNEGTEALLAMGITPIGAVQSWTGDPWYDHIAEQMEGVEVVGTESAVNVEAIVALKPDLIIGTKLRQEKIYEQLNAIAPTVLSETLKGDWKENFKLYAQAINKVEKGNEVIAAYDAKVETLSGKLGQDILAKKISMVRFLAGDVRIYQKASFSGVVLEQLGFARPENQNVDEFAIRGVTKERVSEMNGDVIFYFTYESGDGEATAVENDWLNDQLFQNLEAVKAGNVQKVSDTTWNTAGGVLAANLMLDDIENYFLK